MKIEAKAKPKWHQFRWRVSNALINIARKVYPKNPELTAFMCEVMVDKMLYGQSIVRVGQEEIRSTPMA